MIRFPCLVGLLLPAVTAQVQPSDVAGRVADLQYVANQVPARDPYFFAHLDPVEFQYAVGNLRDKVSVMSDAEFYVGLAQLMAMAGDAHTQLSLVNSLPVFPLQFRWLDDGVFVASAAAKYAQALGARLVAIGGLPIDQVVQRLATVISHENQNGLQSTAEGYLRSRLTLEGLGIVPKGDTSDLTFRTLAGDEFTLQVGTEAGSTLAAPDWTQGTTPDYLQSQGQFYWFTYSSPNRLIYFKYNRCNDMPGSPFASFAAKLLQTWDANPVDTLVFDFRGNPGGNNILLKPLLDGLPQRLARHVSNPDFRVYVIIDKRSFSAAVDNAMKLKNPALLPGVDLTQVIRTVGEPAGQAPTMYGNTIQFSLPGSGLTGWYATSYFPQPSWIPGGTELIPDLPISIRSTDYFARFDPVMAAILAGGGVAPAAPSGDVITVNGASFSPYQGLTPGSFATAFGSFSSIPEEVQVGGMVGRVVAASSSQVNFIVPDSVAPGRVTISVRAAGKEMATGQVTVTPIGPGIFALPPSDPSQPGAVENQDNSVNSKSNPAAKGSVVQIFATGYGAGSDTVRTFFGDTSAPVVYSGTVFPGLWQINVQVPDGASGQVPVFLAGGGVASNGVTIWVQ